MIFTKAYLVASVRKPKNINILTKRPIDPMHTGAPHLEFEGAMEAEHCSKAGCDVEFTTSNYSITTTPQREWRFVVNMDTAGADMRHDRRVLILEELSQLDTAKTAKLCRVELIAVTLYTGPMVRIPSHYLR
jgi:hypothetical protein